MSETLYKKAWKDALGGGLPGMAAMMAQVSSLMWLRTAINYQYRYGTTTKDAFQILYKEGGIRRFYRGYSAAMIQGPLSRFGDTAANNGILSLLSQSSLPIGVQTGVASCTAGAFRILLMPIDTIKTILQVEGSQGTRVLRQKIKDQGVKTLFHGSMAASVATIVGHYPWFATYNYLQQSIPIPEESKQKLVRNAGIGFASAAMSDVCSNSIRVIKTVRQTSGTDGGYSSIVQSIVQKDGWHSLFTRGLKTKIITNGVQGMLFSVYWKLGQEYLEHKK